MKTWSPTNQAEIFRLYKKNGLGFDKNEETYTPKIQKLQNLLGYSQSRSLWSLLHDFDENLKVARLV